MANPSKAIWQALAAEVIMTLVPVQCHRGGLTLGLSHRILTREPFATLISLIDMMIVQLPGGVSKTIPMTMDLSVLIVGH